MCHETEEWCKMWGGTDLFFEKWYEKSDKFWPSFQKFENFHLHGLLLIKVHNDWITGKLCVITLKNDTKFEEELTCPLEMSWRILWIFTQHSKVSKFAF